MSLVEFAENELNRLLRTCTDSESLHMQRAINNDILDIVKTFSNQCHSGFSASYSLNILKRLLDYKPLSAVTDADDEWTLLDYTDDIQYQSVRCPSLFKDAEGKVYNTAGKVFSSDNGHTWYTNADSRVYVELPYAVPDKPEYVIIDNQDERLEVLKHIMKVIESLGIHMTDVDISEDVDLESILDKSKFKELEDILVKDYDITKPLFSLQDGDCKLWNVINFVTDSEKSSDKDDEKDTEETTETEKAE